MAQILTFKRGERSRPAPELLKVGRAFGPQTLRMGRLNNLYSRPLLDIRTGGTSLFGRSLAGPDRTSGPVKSLAHYVWLSLPRRSRAAAALAERLRARYSPGGASK